ncbi:MAG: glycoside hydrolase family 127 protein [Pseudonocardiaceae bacterium]|nr:glycoside hydrolase family 127 protein [Pseudonocardiaceae bacterium]
MTSHPALWTEAAENRGPVQLTPRAAVTLHPASDARITAGLWHERRAVNARSSIPDGFERLREAGNFHDLRLAAGTATGEYVNDLPFMDSDLYKWLEAVGWAQSAAELPDPGTQIDFAVELLGAAQEPSGYLQSYFQVLGGGERFSDLAWGHELYCAGHLIQAAVAHQRVTGRGDLLDIACRFADHVDDVFGPGRARGICGHPEIETGLVELYRCTGEQRYLRLAQEFIDRRGHGLLATARQRGRSHGSRYWQDHLPVRDATEVAGHAVRQLYLLAGVVDVAVETGERELLDAAKRLWEDMAATKTYLTGGIGAHHTDEAFGDAYELPSERAYCETCAAIGSVMFSWRLLLATGRTRYADLIERTLHNGFLAGVSLSGDEYLYINPLQVRDGHQPNDGDRDAFRTPWFRCACCPPNVMRLLASLHHYVAATDGSGLVLHQYMPGEYATGELAVRVDTTYPWDGTVSVEVIRAPSERCSLVLRLPQWADRYQLSVSGEHIDVTPDDGWLRVLRAWQPGDVLRFEMEMAPRLTAADPRIDAVRECVAIERGPLVYCLEQTDQPSDIRLDDVVLDANAPLHAEHRPDLLGGVVTLTASGGVRERPDDRSWWPYRPLPEQPVTVPDEVSITAIPYYAWGNRDRAAMRVWLPRR